VEALERVLPVALGQAKRRLQEGRLRGAVSRVGHGWMVVQAMAAQERLAASCSPISPVRRSAVAQPRLGRLASVFRRSAAPG